MSVHHLAKGSQLPPFAGKLRVYSMRFCPYAQRTSIILSAKKIPYEVVNINLTDKPEWLTSKSPLGKVPALEVENDVIVYESLITCEYLDDKYPQPPLVSKDPLQKALDKLVVENFSKAVTSFYKGLMHKDNSNENIEAFLGSLEEIQNEMTKRSTKFLAGSKPGMVDYMIWPWFERFGLLPKYSGSAKFTIDPIKFETLITWIELMKSDPAVKASYLDLETHDKFMSARINGTPDYDFLL